MPTTQEELGTRRRAALATPSDLGAETVKNITGALNGLLAELREDNRAVLASMREVHYLGGESNDVATTSLVEKWIDETERRIWFLFESGRKA